MRQSDSLGKWPHDRMQPALVLGIAMVIVVTPALIVPALAARAHFCLSAIGPRLSIRRKNDSAKVLVVTAITE
jgi:hypothetical protein